MLVVVFGVGFYFGGVFDVVDFNFGLGFWFGRTIEHLVSGN